MIRSFAFGHSRPLGAGGGGAPGVLQPGVFYRGACGHLDQGGPYHPTTGIPYATQAAHLKNIFGTTPKPLYRAFGDNRALNLILGDVTAFQALGITPVVTAITYPPWGDFASENAAYNWAYAQVEDLVEAAPTVQVYEIGNEWNLQSPFVDQHVASGQTGLLPSHWTSLAAWPLMRGAQAGATRAIRDHAPAGTQIIGGAGAGWIKLGFVPALADALQNYGGNNLLWDFTCCHWYDGQFVNGFGLPDSINGGPNNAYVFLKPSSATPKPIIFTEFGASTGGGSNDPTAAARITGLMGNFLAHQSGSATELGVRGGIVFELYNTTGFPDYKLYTYSGGSTATIAPQGTAVKAWVEANL